MRFLNKIKYVLNWVKYIWKMDDYKSDYFMIYEFELKSLEILEKELLDCYKYISIDKQHSNIRDLRVLQKLLKEIIEDDFLHKSKRSHINVKNANRYISDPDLLNMITNKDTYYKMIAREFKVKYLYNKIRSERLETFWI